MSFEGDILLALVKEYLSSSEVYKEVLASFIRVTGATKSNSRGALAKQLGIFKRYSEYKSTSLKIPSLLEILVESITSKRSKPAIQSKEISINKTQNVIPDYIQNKATKKSHMHKSDPSIMQIIDLDLVEDTDFEVPTPFNKKEIMNELSSNMENELHSIIFGTRLKSSLTDSFPLEWRDKGFNFNSNNELFYGLVQIKGGPCGLLAAVQAHIIKHLYHSEIQAKTANIALVRSLTDIIWHCSNGKSAFLFIEKVVFTFSSKAELEECISRNIQSFSLINLLVSAILTRGLSEIKQDVGESDSFIGRHGYCTLELVNLLIIGKAYSNVFDGDINVDGIILKGIPKRADIGFLTLFEHYKSLKVGSNLKNPKFPIFIVCSESHFTVLFSKSTANEKKLYYYDGLANQSNEISLRLSFDGGDSVTASDDAPPLELCIRTKWHDVRIEWFGSDPLF